MKITESIVRESPLSPEEIQPGEIWELSSRVQSPLQFDPEERDRLYPEVARLFLDGNSPPRYVVIVKEPEPLADSQADPDEEWRVLSVMLLSDKTHYLSDVDILIPAHISGVGRDLLAETWHVLPMLACNLSAPLGKRLSRPIYNLLLDVGDYYHDLIEQRPSDLEIQSLGLQVGTASARQDPEIQAFHQQELDWAAVLEVPVAAYNTYLKTLAVTDVFLEMAWKLAPTELSQWLRNKFALAWQAIEQILPPAKPAFGFRKTADTAEITALIEQLNSDNEQESQRAIRELGEIGAGNPKVIKAIENLIDNREDEQILWAAADSLLRIDPENPAAGVRKGKLIDLGTEADGETVALTVALIQKKSNEKLYILLRAYPAGNSSYLPEYLQLILLEESGETILAATSSSTDAYIQLMLSGIIGEKFSARLALGDYSIVESFVI